MGNADKLIRARDLFRAVCDDTSIRGTAFVAIRRHINAAPAVETVDVVHGQWEFGELEPMGQSVHCSVCGWGSDMVHKAMWLEYPGHQYCGKCGAKMVREGGTDNGSIG